MLDSSYKSLDDFTFASPMRKSSSRHAHHIVDAFATICWFHEIRLHINATTVVQIRRKVEPLVGATQEEEKGINRRWRDYRDGRHSPMESVIAKAQACCPGTQEVLESPLWTALRLDKPANQAALALMGCVSKAGNELLARALNIQANGHIDPRWLKKCCDALVSEGSLEGLGTLTICMRLAVGTGEERLALNLYRSATRSLLILGGWMFNHGIARGIAQYYEYVLLPSCIKQTYLATFSSDHYLRMVFTLQKAIEMRATKEGRELSNEEAVATMLELL